MEKIALICFGSLLCVAGVAGIVYAAMKCFKGK